MANEVVCLVLVRAAGADGEQPVDVERDGTTTGSGRDRGNVDLTLDRTAGLFADGGEAEPVDHHRDLARGKAFAALDRIDLLLARRCRRAVVDQLPVEVECGNRRRGIQRRHTGGVDQLAVAAPELETEVVYGVVAVRVASEDGAPLPGCRAGEEAGHRRKLVPRTRYRQPPAVLVGKGGLRRRVGEEVTTVDQTLRSVVVGQ